MIEGLTQDPLLDPPGPGWQTLCRWTRLPWPQVPKVQAKGPPAEHCLGALHPADARWTPQVSPLFLPKPMEVKAMDFPSKSPEGC